MIRLSTHPRSVVFAPAFVAVHVERRDGGLNLREALCWRRSG